MIGKIYEKLDEDFGYIIDNEGKLYLFSIKDILDDTKLIVGTEVLFKPIQDKILRATLISKAE